MIERLGLADWIGVGIGVLVFVVGGIGLATEAIIELTSHLDHRRAARERRNVDPQWEKDYQEALAEFGVVPEKTPRPPGDSYLDLKRHFGGWESLGARSPLTRG